MRITCKMLAAALFIICAYFAVWYTYPAVQQKRIAAFIEGWNLRSESPYRIEYDSIEVRRSILSSPLHATVAIANMRLIMKEPSGSQPPHGDVLVSCWWFGRNNML